MSTTGKIAIGVGLASGALLAAWLLTGTRKQKTRQFIVTGKDRIKETLKKEDRRFVLDDAAAYYI